MTMTNAESRQARVTTFSTKDIRGLLAELIELAEELDGATVEVDMDRGKSRVRNPDAAVMSRKLIRAGDLADLLAGEFKALHWQYKGWRDPRDRFL